MKKRLYFIVILFSIVLLFILLLFRNSHSNIENKYSSSLSLKDSIEQYHEFINEAELNICDNNYSKALENYYKAFSFIKSPFPLDLYHVVLLNTYMNKNKDALKYSRNLVKLGVNLKFFNQKPLNKLKSDLSEWNKFIKDYNLLHKFYKDNINFKLKKQIVRLNISDQKNYCNIDINTGTIPLINIQDTVFEKCYNIIKKFGYPNHDLIGINIKNDTDIIDSPEIVIFRHYFQESYRNLNELSSLLLKEVYKGKLKPIHFMIWDEFKYEPYPHYGSEILNKTNKGYYIKNLKLNEKEINRYNNNRKKIFMYSYNDELKKLIFMQKFRKLKFKFPQYNTVISNDFPPYFKFKVFTKINLDDY